MKITRAEAQELYRRLMVRPGSRVSLARDFDPGYKPDFVDKEDADDLLKEGIEELAELQARLYAQDIYALLVIFQALDAAGKDGTIKHVMSGLNPLGCQAFSFKAPSHEELDHDYLWRNFKALPERGRIGIFNRSYYEECLVVRVHSQILAAQRIPPQTIDEYIWERRFDHINNFEKYLVENGVLVLKFFLNVSRQEQKKRFLERINEPDKNWKFTIKDVKERAFWNDYMRAYEDVFNQTSTDWAPWYVVPADRKWLTRFAVGYVILDKLRQLNLTYPALDEARKQELLTAKEMLESEPE